MSFPNVPRVIYEKTPLQMVTCQFRFSPLLSIETDTPSEFQNRLRVNFPEYRKGAQFIQEIELSGTSKDANPPAVCQNIQQSVVHEFSSIDGSSKIRLSKTFLSITTTQYHCWEDFWALFDPCVQSLVEIYTPSYFSHISLEYRDVFEKEPLGLQEYDWKDLIQPHFLGLLSTDIAPAIKRAQAMHEVTLEEGLGTARILTALFENSTNSKFIVNSEFFSNSMITATETARAFSIVKGLHRQSSRLIRFVITEKLHNAMNPTPIEGE